MEKITLDELIDAMLTEKDDAVFYEKMEIYLKQLEDKK